MTTSTDRFNGLIGSSAVKPAVVVATTANITLSGLQTIDGITLIADDRVLVKDQTNAVNNGIWIASSGQWSRSEDFNGIYDAQEGTLIVVSRGNANSGRVFILITQTPIIGTSNLTFSERLTASGIREIATVVDLRNFEPQYAGQIITLLGHTTAGVGGGDFRADLSDTTTADDNGLTIVTTGGKRWKRILENNEVIFDYFGLSPSKTSATTIYNLIVNGVSFSKPNIIHTLDGVASQWASGNKFPVVFYGDSTTDGRVSTTNGTNEVTLYNLRHLIDGDIPDGLTYDHDLTEAPNCYVSILQKMARNFYGNDVLRCYNAGFRNQEIQNGWATDNIHNAIFGNTIYSDAKIVFINFGINDSNSASGETLRLNTYRHTKALILDCYLRGVQPVLMATNPTSIPSELDYGYNKEQVQIIDQVKKQLCQEFNLEYIDMATELLKFFTNNTFPYSTDFIMPDDFHMGDIGHNHQAQILLCKYLAKDMILTLNGGDKFLDASMVYSKFNGRVTQLSNSTFNRGANQIRTNIIVTTSQYDSYAGSDIVDLWVYNETPRMSLVYKGLTNPQCNGELITDTTKLPQLSVQSELFTANDFSINNLYNNVVPGFVGQANATIKFDFNYFIANLDFGLNRIKIFMPSDAQTHRTTTNFFTTGSLFIGSFAFIENHINNSPKTAIYDNASIGQTRGVIKNALEKTGVMFAYSQAPTSTDFMRIVPCEDIKGANTYSLRRVGDSVELLISFNTSTDGWGVIIASNKSDNNGISIGNGFDKNKDIMTGSNLCLYLLSGQLRFAGILANGTIIGSVVNTGIVTASVANKNITVSLSLTSTNEITWVIFDDTGTQLGTGTFTGHLVAEFNSGIVGGVFNNRSATTTGFIKIDLLQIREIYL